MSAARATGPHWSVGVLLLVLGLVVAVAVVAQAHRAGTNHPQATESNGVTALLGLLAAAALAVLGAGLLSTGDLTVLGWGPFAVAGIVVLTPPVLGLLLSRPGLIPRQGTQRAHRNGS